MQKHLNNTRQSGILSYLLLLTGFFLLFELSFFILLNKAYLNDFTFISNQMKIPASILPGILLFIGAQLVLHLLFAVTVWLVATFNAYLLRLSADYKFKLALTLWFVGAGAIVSLNQYLYPISRFSEISSLIMFNPAINFTAVYFFSTLFIVAALIAACGFMLWLIERSLTYASLFMLGVVACSWMSIPHFTQTAPTHVAVKHTQPNIILIGVDSMRPDFLSYFGADHPTPFIDNILNQSTVFAEAFTPLARTFPSWSSILLGQYPKLSGIRFNLANIDHVDLTNSLPAILKKNGYLTIYATDETRFSNIDKRFGFDETITPPIGLNDFLLGSFNDFPLSNLMLNTEVGHWLFPFSYGNRAAYTTYDPDSFLALMRPALMKSQVQPLFMAIHFCLPHSPYLWATAPINEGKLKDRYQASVERVDQQIQTFFTMLQEARLLDHTIVVLLSDHGEALELPGDRITEAQSYLGRLNTAGEPPAFYPASIDNQSVNQTAGHGTDVLGLPQYHSLLAFKLYGMGRQYSGVKAGAVPLTDIKQAVLSLAEITPSHPSPLASIVRGNLQVVPLQHIFLESDYSPSSIRTVFPETRNVLLEGIRLFQIDSVSTRLTVKHSMGEMIIRSKQYADVYGDWMLALYPQSLQSRTSVLVNLKTGQWTDNMNSTFAQQSPADIMMAQLKQFYAEEI